MAFSNHCSYRKSLSSLLIKKLFILFVLLSSANEVCLAQNTKVTVYSDDFKGNEASFGVGQYDYMTLVKAGVSVIRSARVPEGMQITLYLDDQFKGKQLIITEDANQAFIMAKGFGNLHNNVSMAVSIAPVTKGPKVTIYKDNFSGESKSLAPGNYDYTDLGKVANDNISSISIPKGLKVTLFEHGGFAGRKLELKADASANDLVKNKFNDVTSSLRVEVVEEPTKEIVVEKPGVTKPVEKPVEEKLPEVVEPQIAVIIYQGNFSGNSNVLKPGKYNATDLGIGNEELSSIDIHSSLRVTLYEHGNFKGRTLQLTTRTSTERLTESGWLVRNNDMSLRRANRPDISVCVSGRTSQNEIRMLVHETPNVQLSSTRESAHKVLFFPMNGYGSLDDSTALKECSTISSINAACCKSDSNMVECLGDVCSICLTAYKDGDFVVCLPCCHIYHDQCLSPWISLSARCPLCRCNLEEMDN